MKSSELASALRNFAGQIASGSQEIDPKLLIHILLQSAERLERSTKLGLSSFAYENATKHGKPNPLDFAFGTEWLANQIEDGNLP